MINDVAASGDEPGAAIFMSVFFIKLCPHCIAQAVICGAVKIQVPVKNSACMSQFLKLVHIFVPDNVQLPGFDLLDSG